ncbi:MAG: hypothetical protein RLN59_02220 [Haliea sp.]|uniref:hypothetical protein n=1 Tax=Marinobacter salarius TaxID=1420917 RepID=UPI0032EBBEA6
MEWLDRPLGPMRVRAWGLLANMLTNALALYGLSQVLSNGSGHVLLAAGVGLSVMLIALLAVPSR